MYRLLICCCVFRYCLHGDLVQECPMGFYCPAGTGIDWQPCPRGTFNNETGLARSEQCKACIGGYYCDELSMVSYKGPCDAGYYCEYGVDRARPSGDQNNTVVNGTCLGTGTHAYPILLLQVNLDMTDSMGPGKLVRHMQYPSYTYDEYLICIGLGPSISSVICKNLSYSGPSFQSSPVYKITAMALKMQPHFQLFQM